MQHLFVYGSLLFPELVLGLTGKVFKTATATLYGFKRYSVAGADYPAILPNKSSQLYGRVLFDVDDKSLNILTFYEGEDYDKSETTVTIRKQEVRVLLYVWNAKKSDLRDTEWHKKKFEEESLAYYKNHIIPETVNAFQMMHTKLNS